MDNTDEQIVDLDNQNYNQDYEYQNGVESYQGDDQQTDKANEPDQIDSTLALNQQNKSSSSNKDFDPLGQIPQMSGLSALKQTVQKISTEDTYDQKETEAKMQRGEFVNNIQSMMIDIPSFEEKKADGGKSNVIFYKVVVGFSKNKKRWFLEKRYSEFDALDKSIRDLYPNI